MTPDAHSSREAAAPKNSLSSSYQYPGPPKPSQSQQSDTAVPELHPNLSSSSSAKRQKTEHHPSTTTTITAPSSVTTTSMAATAADSSSQSFLETIPLEHVPRTHSVHVAVFRDVENAAFLHQQLLSRNADFEYAFIDAAVITSRLQVLSAVFKAITVQLAGTMKTPNVHSEIVCSLSPTNNIAEAYRRHGMTSTSRSIVVVKVIVSATDEQDSSITTTTTPTTPQKAVEQHLLSNVKGTPVPFTDDALAQLTDTGRVRKYYKLNGVNWLDGIRDQPTKKKTETDALIVSGMALRGL